MEKVEEKRPGSPETEIAKEKQYYTVKQIARKFGFTSAWISHLCKIGRIKAIRPSGRDWRISPEEYDKIVKEGLPTSAKNKPTPITKEIPVLVREPKKVEPEPKEGEEKKPERYFPFNLIFKD